MMKSILVRSCPCSTFVFEANREAHPAKFASTVRCSSRSHANIPKLKPFSRTKLDRAMPEPPMIEKCENDLSEYCTTLEGDECSSCWRAYFELKELEKEMPKEDVEKLIFETGRLKYLVGRLHDVAGMQKEKKYGSNSAQPLPLKETKKAERLCPIPDGLPKSNEEMEEEESWKLPDSPWTRLLRNKGAHPAWYTPRPDHETD